MNASVTTLIRLRQASARASIGPIRKLVGSRALTATFVLLLFLLGSCLYIWQRVEALDLLAEVGELQAENRFYRDARAKVEADVAKLSQISRMYSLAEKNFGLTHVQVGRLYAIRFPEESVGESGMRELWGALNRSVARLPSIQSNEAAAQGLFDKDR